MGLPAWPAWACADPGGAGDDQVDQYGNGRGQETSMDVQGFVAAGFEPVRECFAEILGRQAGTGAAFAAWSDGRWLADLWGGYADLGRHRPWQAGSLVQPYSVSKPFAAICALRLAETGRLDLDAPVQRYWPSSAPRRLCGMCCRTRPGWYCWTSRSPPRRSMTGTTCAACWRRRNRPGSPAPRTGNRRFSTGTWPGSWCAGWTGAGSASSCAKRSAGRNGLDFAFGLNPAQQARTVDLAGLRRGLPGGQPVWAAQPVPAGGDQPARRA